MSGHLNFHEQGALVIGWVVSFVLWFHFIVIAICEPDGNRDNGFCEYYIYSTNSTEDSTDTDTVTYSRNEFVFTVIGIAYVCHILNAPMEPMYAYMVNVINMPLVRYQQHLIDARPTCWFRIPGNCWNTPIQEEFQFTSFRSSCCVAGAGVIKKEEELQPESCNNILCEVRAGYPEVMRIRITKELEFLDEQTEKAYNDQFSSFTKQNRREHHQIYKEIEIPDCRHDYFLAYSPDNRPLGHSIYFLFLCTLLTLNWPYYTYLCMSTKAVDLVVTKEVSLTQNGDENAPTDEVADPDNEQIEHV